MMIIPEGDLQFEFDDAVWTALKWDEHAAYIHGIGKLQGAITDTSKTPPERRPEGTKAVDIVALHAHGLYLIEVKDFRRHAPQNAFRQEEELPLEVGLKVRDTVAGLVGAHTSGRASGRLAPFARALLEGPPVQVIAWILDGSPDNANSRRKHSIMDNIRLKKLQQRLAWLTGRVWVDDPLAPSVPLPGLRVRQL